MSKIKVKCIDRGGMRYKLCREQECRRKGCSIQLKSDQENCIDAPIVFLRIIKLVKVILAVNEPGLRGCL